jgi:hypothetical protein
MMLRLVQAALLIALGVTLWWSTSQAQDPGTCESECHAQREMCIQACGEHSNPIECEGSCRDEYHECTDGCG